MVEEQNKSRNNAKHLAEELNWLSDVISYRIRRHFQQEGHEDAQWPTPPKFSENSSVYARFVQMYGLTGYERLAVILSLAPIIRPSALDAFFLKDQNKGGTFSSFGGVKSTGHSGFIPTGETFLFVAAGNDLGVRFRLQSTFSPDHIFAKHGVLYLERSDQHDPFLSGALTVSREYIDLFTHGNVSKPTFGKDFPAKELTTDHTWDDLVLGHHTAKEIEEVKVWVKHGKTIMEDWGLGRKLKPGYLSLFYGPPGTGKTLTAILLGKLINKPVYRIDLSLVVSKYIGETEKNLASVFDQAENKNWILFFDEADALFGKRTKVNDAHDRYANQEVSYLLQRVEDFSGLVILASNLKSNMDEAFTRRFQSMINFPLPDAEERHILWKRSFSDKSVLEKSIDLQAIASKYTLSGGAIMNIVRYCSLLAVARGSNEISRLELEEGIKREFRKGGKLV